MPTAGRSPLSMTRNWPLSRMPRSTCGSKPRLPAGPAPARPASRWSVHVSGITTAQIQCDENEEGGPMMGKQIVLEVTQPFHKTGTEVQYQPGDQFPLGTDLPDG